MPNINAPLCLTIFMVLSICTSAFPAAQSQNTTFNSTAVVTPEQITKYDLNQTWADAISLALQFEQSNWATGSARSDEFYNPPAHSNDATSGSVLKIVESVNMSQFTSAPSIAMSKFLYMSETFNGTAVPASAFVLWPYLPRRFNVTGDKLPLVGWAHGTIGWSAECGPSHLRNLQYQFAAPFELPLQGYAVVAPDYTGLGVGTDANGERIPNQYMAHPVAANDLAYAIEAAQKAWPILSQQFVAMGHSLGGGSAWSFAQRQAVAPLEGYLGTVAGSPVGGLLDEARYQKNPFQRIVATAQSVNTIFPSFQLNEWLTDRGISNIQLQLELQGCASVANELLSGTDMVKEDWNQTWTAQQFDQLTRNGGKPFADPMLVMQGSKDANVPIALTDKNVEETCDQYPLAQLQYYTFDGTEHVPTLYASRRIYLEWIADRFNGVALTDGCQKTAVEPVRPVSDYAGSYDWFIEYALWSYELP